MKCFLCKGDMKESNTTHVADMGNCIIIIKNVPCFECEQCGEVSYSGVVAKKLEEVIKSMSNAITEIAVIQYPDMVA